MGWFQDGLRNLVANLGTGQDKAAATVYVDEQLSPDQLRTAYRSSWICKKIVNAPAQDATRRWRTWQADAAEISAIEKEEKRLGLKRKVKMALQSARLYGGSAILIGAQEEDVSEPLDPEKIGANDLRFIRVLSRRELVPGQIVTRLSSEFYGLPEIYEISTQSGEHLRIHASRLGIFSGAYLPDTGAERVDPWGDSVLQACLNEAKNTDAAVANVASMVFEAKVDTIGIPNLTALLSKDPVAEQKLIERLNLAARAKSINGMLIHGSEEIIGQKQLSFQGLPDVLDRFFQVISGASEMPVTRFFGSSPAGLNATGESDMRNYYDLVQDQQENDVGPAIGLIDECLIRSALGDRPEEIHYDWRPLWQPTEKERSDNGKTLADTLTAIHKMDVIPPEAIARTTVTTMTEAGMMPGLEDAFEEFYDPDLFEAEADRSGEEEPEPVSPARFDDATPRTLYVHRKVQNAQAIIAWARSQGFKKTLPADDLHVTIAFSRNPLDWMKIGQSWEEGIEVPTGGPRLMEAFGEARVLLFRSFALEWRHGEMREAGASWDHGEYQPHITISYDPDAPDLADVQPYQGPIILGPEVFQEVNEKWLEGIREDDT